MTLHVCKLHGCVEDEVGRRGACIGVYMLVEYDKVVTPLHGSMRDEEITLYGISGDAEMER